MNDIAHGTCNHRGEPHFWWRLPGDRAVRRRKIKHPNDPVAVERQRVQVLAAIMAGKTTKKVKQRNKPLHEHLEDFLAAHKVGATGRGKQPQAKQNTQARVVITRILEVAKITTLAGLEAGKIKRVIGELHRISHKKFKTPAAKTAHEAKLQPLSTGSRNRYVMFIKSFSKWLVESGVLEADPLARLKKWPAHDDNPRTRFEPTEIEALLKAANAAEGTLEGFTGPERARLYLVAMATGLRKSELATLTPTSFDGLDGESPVLYVQSQYTKNGELAEIGLHESLVPMLREWLPTLGPHDPLFPRLATSRAAYMVHRDCKAAGVPRCTPAGERRDFHALRHVHISLLWDIPGITGMEVMLQARHKSLGMTMRYSHAERSRRAATARRLTLPAYPSLVGSPSGSAKG